MIRRRGNRPNLPSVKEVLHVYWVRQTVRKFRSEIKRLVNIFVHSDIPSSSPSGVKLRVSLRNWNSGFNWGSGSTLFHRDFTIPKSKTLSKNYIHSSLVLDQKLSDKGILRLYCLSHACHSKMSVFRCLRDLSVQIVRRSTLNRLEVHFRVQGHTKLVQIQKVL